MSGQVQIPQEFLPKKAKTSLRVILRRTRAVLADNISLIEAFFLALSVHVLLFPVLWIMGWALPFPKSPVITTIIEFDLSHWPEVAKTKKVIDIRYPEQNQ
jgi:hypothetical protein